MIAALASTGSALDSIETLMSRALARGPAPVALTREARRVAREARRRVQPAFVARQLRTLETMTRLAEDPAARIGAAARERLLGALAYVAEADDLIPDATPDGLVDDAIVIDLVARELRPELPAYAALCREREPHAARRAMHARMERRREQRARRGGLFALR